MDEIVKILRRIRLAAMVVGAVGLAASLAGFFAVDRELFLSSYLTAFIYVLGPAAGSLSVLMIYHLTSGRWGFVIQRLLESAAKTLPLMALLFVPVALGMDHLYHHWLGPEAAHDHLLQSKSAYLNRPFFLVRAGLYFGVLSLLAFRLSSLSHRQDRTRDPSITTTLRVTAGPGLVVFVLLSSCAAIDWGMSLDPHWFSTMYPVPWMVGHGVLALSLMAMMLNAVGHRKPFSHLVTHQQFHDIGNLIFAFTIFWTYVSLSQFLIIWSANIPEETGWYIMRSHGGWQYVAAFLGVFLFAAPFFILLNRPVKRHGAILARVALFIIVVRYSEYFFLVGPTFRETVYVHWLDAALVLGLGGLWMTVFLTLVLKRCLVAYGDPRFHDVVAGHGHQAISHQTHGL